MTTLVCRVGTPARLLIRTRQEAGRYLYAGTITEDTGRPMRPLHKDTAGHYPTAPVRLAPQTAAGLTELIIALDGDAELFR